MEMWFSEIHTQNMKLSIRTEKQLFSGESEYQSTWVSLESPEFGRFLTLEPEIFCISMRE